jgi:AhpD family alkylhydroperoxidase
MKLDPKTIDLVAVGAAVTANCQPCLEHIAGMARAHGVDDQEIAEAIMVGRKVRKGAASKFDKFAGDLTRREAGCAMEDEAGCGCSVR